MILTWKTTPSHLWYSDASDERRLIESLLSLIFIVLDKIMNKFLWLKSVLIMYINIKGDECKNHVIVNCILPLLTLCQCIFALVWAAFIEKFKKNSKHVCYHSCQVYLSKIKTLQEQRKTIFLYEFESSYRNKRTFLRNLNLDRCLNQIITGNTFLLLEI